MEFEFEFDADIPYYDELKEDISDQTYTEIENRYGEDAEVDIEKISLRLVVSVSGSCLSI